ncbi:VOG4599 [uncultured phage cr109_1]|uniref:Minor structural protein n=2 Tax=root TaxID=1 RepID=A0A7M1RRW7_9CAUD|nr:VOG4599 [uncultured phage cr109_1]QOR57026.1 minor structural protein [uncultured phage cr109_1]
MIQIIDNFEHRSKLPNFARDQFDTLEEMKNVRDEDIDEGHISYCISTDKHYKFNASNAIDLSTGKWREFKGEKGDPGKDGQDGTNVLSNLTAFIFKSSETIPSKPVGGSWNSDTNVFTPPTGWYTTDQNMVGTIWMSWAVFLTTGTIQGEWSTPVRITGENGKDGLDGKSIEFIYKVSNRVPNSSDKPSSVNEDGSVPDGWTDHPTGVSKSNQYEWMCVRTKTDDLWSDWNGPTVWSKWGANGKDGDGVEYVYKRTTTNLSPDRPTEVSQEDDFVPEGWTDDPTGVNENNMYEWVCVRKYKEGIWSEFSNPALWAKWGEKGEPGKDGPQGVPGPAGLDGKTLYTWIRYAEDANGTGISNSPDGKSYIGLAYNKETASESNNPSDYTWSKITGKDGVAGPAGEDGKTLYTWIKYADTMPSSSSSTIYDIPNLNTKYIGIAVNKDTASESTDAMVYTWSLFRGADGTNGKDGRDGRIVYPAGIYDATVTYTATVTKAPYVLYGDTYYVMNVTTSWTGSLNDGKTPADDYEQYGEHATWIPMEKFEAIYTKLLIADNGTLGRFVFNGDYMFSQQGVDYLYNEVNNYEDFGNDSIPFKFTDTSMWIKSSVSYVSFTDNTINITLGSNSTLTLLSDKLTSGQSIPEFYVQVSGVAEGSTSAYLIWKYYTEDGGTSNYDYIQTSGIIKLHGSVYNSSGSASLSLYTNSTSLDNEITVTLLPTTFIPNLLINGRTGDVVINRGTFKGSIASNWYKVELSGSDTNILAIGEGDTYITITGNGASPNTMRIRLPSYTYSSSLRGKVLTTFHVINLSGSVLDFNNIVGRIFPAYTFPGGNEYSNVFVKLYGKLDVAIVIGGFPVLYYFYVLNPWDFELSDAYTSGTQNPVSKTFG